MYTGRFCSVILLAFLSSYAPIEQIIYCGSGPNIYITHLTLHVHVYVHAGLNSLFYMYMYMYQVGRLALLCLALHGYLNSASWAALAVARALPGIYIYIHPSKTAHYSWLPWGWVVLCCCVFRKVSDSCHTYNVCAVYTIIYTCTCMCMYLWSNILYTDSLRWNGWWLSCLPCSNWKGFSSTPSLTGNVSLNTATICTCTCTLTCTRVYIVYIWVKTLTYTCACV